LLAIDTHLSWKWLNQLTGKKVRWLTGTLTAEGRMPATKPTYRALADLSRRPLILLANNAGTLAGLITLRAYRQLAESRHPGNLTELRASAQSEKSRTGLAGAYSHLRASLDLLSLPLSRRSCQ